MILRSLLRDIARDDTGGPAVELVLMVPLLVTMMFGFFEAGRYLQAEHVVTKAVRDAARYAARQPFTEMPCGTPVPSVVSDVQNMVRFEPGGTTPRTTGSADMVVNVTVVCPGTGSYANAGIYEDLDTGARYVLVSATDTYQSLFGNLGFGTAGLQLRASAQSAVTGV